MQGAANRAIYAAVRAMKEGRAHVHSMPGVDLKTGKTTRCVIVRRGETFLTVHRTQDGKNSVKLHSPGHRLECDLPTVPAIFERYLSVGVAA